MEQNKVLIAHTRPIIIGIVAGEISGDILGFELIKSLKKHLKTVSFFGIGGTRMQSEKMECWYDIAELSVMGIVEIILKLPKLLNIKRKLLNKFLMLKPDIFIGIDFPDFNISLEKHLKKKGINTIHYVSPSIWAWRTNRIFNIKQATNAILVLFPFEKLIYDKFNVPCELVGHTLADKIPFNPNKFDMRRKLNILQHKKCLAILPGSRFTEINRLTKVFLNCAKLLSNIIPNLEILIPLSNQELVNHFLSLASSIAVKFRIFCTQESWEVMVASDAAILTAGTATLECMLAKCPMVVAYKMHPITFFVIKRLIKIPWISLPNLLSNYNLVQEFVQKDCNLKNLTKAIFHLLNYNHQQLQELQEKFCKLHQSIKLDANEKITQIILKYL